MGFWFAEWIKFDYVSIKFKEDHLTQRGMAAFGVLCWLVLSSVAPIRGLAYELFVSSSSPFACSQKYCNGV